MKLHLNVCLLCGLVTGCVIAVGTWCHGDEGETNPLCPFLNGLIWALILGILCMCAATEHDPGKGTDQQEPFFPMLGKSLAFGLAAWAPFCLWQLCCLCS